MDMMLRTATLARALDVAAVPVRLGPHDDAAHASERIVVESTRHGALFTAATRRLISRTLAPSYRVEPGPDQHGPARVEIDGTGLRHVLDQLKAGPDRQMRLSWDTTGLLLHLDPEDRPLLLRDLSGTGTRQAPDVDAMLDAIPDHSDANPAHDGPLCIATDVLQRLTAAIGRHPLDDIIGTRRGPTLRTHPTTYDTHVSWSCQEWAFGAILSSGMAGDLNYREVYAGTSVRTARPYPQNT